VIRQAFLVAASLVLFPQPVVASTESRWATITGGGGDGNCTITVEVDGSAEVEVSGNNGLLTTLSGRPARWRRFQCNEPPPRNPVDFRFAKVAGRGSVRLLEDPRRNGGRAVFQIDDSKGGQASYTVNLQWRRFGGGGWSPGPPGPAPAPWPGPPGGFPIARAVRACQDAVTDRLSQDGYTDVGFERTIPNHNPGPNDSIVGTASGTRGIRKTWFRFSCSVDFRSGRIRSVDVVRR
jgi:hypothetical protein